MLTLPSSRRYDKDGSGQIDYKEFRQATRTDLRVPTKDMVLGIDGSAAAGSIATIASDVKAKQLGGVMVWYASLLDRATGKPGLLYGNMDASNSKLGAWEAAVKAMQP